MAIVIETSQNVSLESGFNEVHIHVHDSMNVSLTIPANTEGSVYLVVSGSGNLAFTLDAQVSSNWKYLWINQSNEALVVDEHLILNEHAHLVANYGEMSLGDHHKKTHIEYVGAGSHVDFRGAIISFNNLKWTIKADHQAKKSYAMVNCNAIVLDEAKLHLEVIGSIAKGNGGSETHQMSRIMNLGETVHGVVYPMLLIDENDVAASHAASVGQPNEEHIYYLQSRGLSRLDALKLIITGYLMPIVDGIDDPAIKEQLTQEITEKVNNQWQ